MTAPAPPAPQYVLEDPAAAHQITLFTVEGGLRIAVGCTCLGRHGNGRGRRYLGVRDRWTVAEAIGCWRAGHDPGVLP